MRQHFSMTAAPSPRGPKTKRSSSGTAQSGLAKTTLRDPEQVVRSLAISPDDRTLAAAYGDGSLTLWDIATDKPLRTIHANAGRIWSVAYSPDGKRLATAGSDRVVKLWRANVDQRAQFIAGLPSRIQSLNLTAVGTRLAVSYTIPEGSTPPAELWQIGSTIDRRPVPLPDCHAVTLAAAGNALAVETGSDDPRHVDLYEGPVWRRRASLDFREPPIFVWSPDGRLLATTSTTDNPPLKIFTAATNRMCVASFPEGKRAGNWTAVFSPDGATLAIGSLNGELTLWDVERLRPCASVQAHPDAVFGLAFAPDGRSIATAAGDRMIRIWDAQTLKERLTIPGHQGIVRAVAFCPDGRTLASVSDDGTLRLWDTETWQEIFALEAHKGGAGQLAFSADGQLLVTGGSSESGTGEVGFWSAPCPRQPSARNERRITLSRSSGSRRRPSNRQNRHAPSRRAVVSFNLGGTIGSIR